MLLLKKIIYNNQNLCLDCNYIKYCSPTTVFLKITSKCMLNCNFCSQGIAGNCEMDINKAKYLLKKLKKENVLRIFYTGGEPFLYSHFKELLEYGHSLGLCQLVITNGFLLNTNKVSSFFKYVNGISISVHGREETHNKIVNNQKSYEKIVEGIDKLKKEYPRIALDICYTATLDNTNFKDISSVAELCKKNKIPLNITRMYNIGKAKEIINDFGYIDRLVSIVKKLIQKKYDINIGHCLVQCNVRQRIPNSFCMAGIDFCFIDINGDIKICGNSLEVIGNAFHDVFKKVWKNNQKKLCKRLKKLPLCCKNCENINTCLGGCKTEISIKNIPLNDSLAISIVLKKWNVIKDKKFDIKIGGIKKIRFNQYLIIGKESAIVNRNVINILTKITVEKTLKENLLVINKSFNEFELKSLFVLLYNNGFIMEKAKRGI